MGDSFDPNVSNGTCYFTEHTETKGNFIPCGNVALGHWPCCHAGDYCLSFDDSNACWNLETGNTYIAGCTDPGFNDRACPWKSTEFNNQEWVAIQQCKKGSGNNDTQWGGCKTSPNSTELEKLPHQSCDPYCTNTLYIGSTALPAFASLPDSTGSSIAWSSGFDPTAVYAPITTTAEVSGLATTITSIETRPPTTSVTATQTTSSTLATSAPTAISDDGLSTGAKAGIGVGSAGAALLIVAVILLALLFRRRKRKTQEARPSPPTEQGQIGFTSPYEPYQTYYSQPSTPKPWSNDQIGATFAGGFKSELPANERPVTSELPADHPTTPQVLPSPHLSPYPSTAMSQSPYATFDSAGTDHVSSFSDTTTIHGVNSRWITPESTGNYSNGGIPLGRASGPTGSISELH